MIESEIAFRVYTKQESIPTTGSCPSNEKQASPPSGHRGQDDDARSITKSTELAVSGETEVEFGAESEASELQAILMASLCLISGKNWKRTVSMATQKPFML